MHQISAKALIAVYAFLPLALGYMLLDHFVFHNAGKGLLPRHPETLLWYTLLFNLPHIFASFFGFADREYLAYYKRPLALGLPIILVLAFLLPWANLYAALFMLVLYTLYHNVSQQAGIATSLMQYRSSTVQLWRYINIIIGLYLYFLIYPPIALPMLNHYAGVVLIPLFVLSILLTLSFSLHSKTREGKYYALGTASIAGVTIFAFFMGYPFFAATTLRIVHDITAFIFYVTHDRNRNRETMHNMLYRILLPDKRLLLWGIPLIAILLTYIVQGGGTTTAIQAFFLISVTHFYIEGFMWKTGSPHRREIAFQF